MVRSLTALITYGIGTWTQVHMLGARSPERVQVPNLLVLIRYTILKHPTGVSILSIVFHLLLKLQMIEHSQWRQEVYNQLQINSSESNKFFTSPT